MGGGRDKRKKTKTKRDGAPHAPGHGAAKTEKKAAANADKRERRQQRQGGEPDADDLDALLASMAAADAVHTAVQVHKDCAPPGPRVNASFTPRMTPMHKQIIMFGGECCASDTGQINVYNDLYIFDCDKEKWSRVESQCRPPPRSAHQAVLHKDGLYIFGGEFTSPNQKKFHHYKDLWRLDLASWAWEAVVAPRGGGGAAPSARSGHRMALHSSTALLFGGFYDTGSTTRYFNDLWGLDLTTLQWRVMSGAASHGSRPTPRGGCQMFVVGAALYVYGGYAMHVDQDDPDVQHGIVQDDMWTWDLQSAKWERLKKAGMAPGPRASFSLAVHKDSAYLFGGVSDNEAKGGEDISSDFHNDLYIFDAAKGRWYAAQYRQPGKGDPCKDLQPVGTVYLNMKLSTTRILGPHQSWTIELNVSCNKMVETKSVDPDIDSKLEKMRVEDTIDRTSSQYKAAVKIQSSFRGHVVRKAYKLYRLGGSVSELLYSPAAYGLDLSSKQMVKPRARSSAQMCIVDGNIWLLGGTVEVGSHEITLDDMWRLNVSKLDGWVLVKENTAGEEIFAPVEQNSSSDDDDDENTLKHRKM